MARQYSLAALTVLELTPPDMVSCAASAGYDAVGIRLIPSTAEEPQHDSIGDTKLIRETKQRSDDLGVRIHDVETLRLKPDTDVKRDYEAFLSTGAQLGATALVVAGFDPTQNRLVDNFAALAELAEIYNLVPNLEFMPYTAVPSLQTAADVLRAVNHHNVGLLIDSLHFDRSLSVPEAIESLPTEWFTYMQLCDGTAERPTTAEGLIHQARHERMVPGTGGIDVLAPLKHLPRDLLMALEVPLLNTIEVSPDVRAANLLNTTRALLAQLD